MKSIIKIWKAEALFYILVGALALTVEIVKFVSKLI